MKHFRLPNDLPRTTFWFSLVLVLLMGGYLTHYPLYWEKGLFTEGWLWMLVCNLVALGLHLIKPQLASTLFCGLLFIYLFFGVGLISGLTTCFFLVSAHEVGNASLKLLYRDNRKRASGATESLVVGLVLYVALWSLLVHFSVNRQWLYLGLLAVPLIWRYCSDSDNLFLDYHHKLHHTLAWIKAAPFPMLVICGSLIGWVARFAFFPTVCYDDQALHLRLWTELVQHHRYSFDFSTQTWSVAPFAVDLLHSIISLACMEDARGSLNLALMFLILGQLKEILEVFKLKVADQLLILLLLASTPMLGNLLTSLQTEMFLAFLCIAGSHLLLTSNEEWKNRNIIPVLSVAGLCMATKLPGALLGLCLIAALAVKLQFFEPSSKVRITKNPNWIPFFILFGVICFAAVHSYIFSYWITGNPTFPLYNAIFKSPFFPLINFFDSRWTRGLSFSKYLRVFFETSTSFESLNYVAGFQYLILFPLALLGIGRKQVPRQTLLLLIPVLGFGLTTFYLIHYWRYIFPVLPLACAIMGSLLLPSSKSFLSSLTWGLVIGCICLNFFFFPGISWMFTRPLQTIYTATGKEELTKLIAPEKRIISRLNQDMPGSRVLMPDRPYGATLMGVPLYVNWYSPDRAKHFSSIKDQKDLRFFINDEHPDFVIWNIRDGSTPGQPKWLLREYLSQFGYPIYQVGTYIQYRLSNAEVTYRKTLNLLTDNSNAKNSSSGKPGLKQSPVYRHIILKGAPKQITSISSEGGVFARYQATFKCSESEGSFVIQINWEVGDPYYRLIPCMDKKTTFAESIPIPVSARKADLFIMVQNASSVNVEKLMIEFL